MRSAQWHRLAITMALAALPLLASCERGEREADRVDTAPARETVGEALRVTEVKIGRELGMDKRVIEETDDFRPTDTVYASVETAGSATSGTLAAKWTFQDGQIVEESTQTISPTGAAVTEFHIMNPEGLSTGRYRVEIKLNGETVKTEDFEVK